MSGGGTTTTTVANKDPWGPAQGYLQDIMGQSAKLYDSGAGSQAWNGALIPGVDPFTSEAMGGTANLARQQASLLQGPYAYGNTIMANQGIAPSMQPALGTLGGVASGGSAASIPRRPMRGSPTARSTRTAACAARSAV